MQPGAMSERQAQLVAVATRILAAEGPRRFTAQRLAAEIGVTPGAIYNHFASMDAIVDAVIDEMGVALFEGFPPAADDPIERLRLFFQRRARVIRANPDLSRLLLTDYLAQAAGPGRAERVHDFKRRSQQFVVGCLREAAAAGTLSGKVSPDAGAVIVLGAVLSLSHASSRITDPARSEQLCDEVWTAIEQLLRRAPRERQDGPRRPTAAAERTRNR